MEDYKEAIENLEQEEEVLENLRKAVLCQHRILKKLAKLHDDTVDALEEVKKATLTSLTAQLQVLKSQTQEE